MEEIVHIKKIENGFLIIENPGELRECSYYFSTLAEAMDELKASWQIKE